MLEGSKISLEGLTEVKGRMIPDTAGEMLRADHEGLAKQEENISLHPRNM